MTALLRRSEARQISPFEKTQCQHDGKHRYSYTKTCADPEIFVRGGPTLIRGGPTLKTFFKMIRGKQAIIETPFKWNFAGGPMMAQH